MKPLADCCKKNPRKHAKYQRKSDGQTITRYRCRQCKRTFSSATTHPACWQKKRHLNDPILKLLSSSVSMNRIALIHNTTYKTVARKLVYLASEARKALVKNVHEISSEKPIKTVVFDELQTIEHTKCKPVSVAVAVDEENRRVLGFEASVMPATGHLAKISRKKYGYRPDKRREGLSTLFENMSSFLCEDVTFKSDLCVYYEPVVKAIFPKSNLMQSKGERATIAGQGELKMRGRDPLFAVNHTLAMMRANINRLVRRTWCTTKRVDRLVDHLVVYVWFHNSRLTVG